MLRERPEDLAKYLWFGMFPFAMVGLVTGAWLLIAASGVVIVFAGLLLVTDYNGILGRISDKYRDSLMFRMQGKHRITRFEGALCLVIGLVWLVGGFATFLN